jgi:lysophospholipase L1-like esterase
MKRLVGTLTLFVVLLSAGSIGAAEPNGKFFFKSGDRIVFLGDSITEQYQYSSYIELFLTTRFPTWNLTFINAGISGDTANGGAARFQKHVLDEKPTAITIDFGMNDGGYGKLNPKSAENFIAKSEAMVEMAKKAQARVALISPNAVDKRNGANRELYLETQKAFYAPLKDLASKHQVGFVDQYAMTRAVLEKIQAAEAKTVQPFPDGVHTSASGGLLMAHSILVGLHAPALVSNVEIDAAAGKSKPQACTIEKLTASPTAVAFDRTDDALPLPVQKEWQPILPYINQLKDLNLYGLKVTGLQEGDYKLQIDGMDAGTYGAKHLAEGVNLGNLLSGPIHDRGQKVLQAIGAKNQMVHQRFRGVVMFNAPDWLADVVAERKPKELASRMEKINAAQADIYKMLKPTAHRFELKQAK